MGDLHQDSLLLDSRLLHIAACTSTLLQCSPSSLPALLQQDANACQCMSSFLDGKGNVLNTWMGCM